MKSLSIVLAIAFCIASASALYRFPLKKAPKIHQSISENGHEQSIKNKYAMADGKFTENLNDFGNANIMVKFRSVHQLKPSKLFSIPVHPSLGSPVKNAKAPVAVLIRNSIANNRRLVNRPTMVCN